MTQEAATPAGFWDRVEQVAEKAVNKYIRAGLLNSASISSGGLTIKGGFLRMLSAATGGVETFYVGPVSPNLPDGSYQPGMIVRRNDGTIALQLYDPIPSAGDYNQFLAWRDRVGNIVVSDDTDSGTGLARPYVPIGMQRANMAEMPKTASASFVDLELGDFYRQHPKAIALVNAGCDASGTTGEVQVLVDDQPVGSPISLAFAVGVNVVGPFAVPGTHMSSHRIKVQARRTAGTGNVCASTSVLGVQS